MGYEAITEMPPLYIRAVYIGKHMSRKLISIHEETYNHLEEMKASPSESFNDVISRLLSWPFELMRSVQESAARARGEIPLEIEVIESVPVPKEPNAIVLEDRYCETPIPLIVYEDLEGKKGNGVKRNLIVGRGRVFLPPGRYIVELQARCEEDRFNKKPNIRQISLYEPRTIKFHLKQPTADELHALQPHKIEKPPGEEPEYRRIE